MVKGCLTPRRLAGAISFLEEKSRKSINMGGIFFDRSSRRHAIILTVCKALRFARKEGMNICRIETDDTSYIHHVMFTGKIENSLEKKLRALLLSIDNPPIRRSIKLRNIPKLADSILNIEESIPI
jgi:hypothetical protein